MYMACHIWPPSTDFFPYRTVVLGLLKLNIKARHEIPEFLNSKPLITTFYLTTFYPIYLTTFYLSEQLVNHEKVARRADNLKFRTDLRDRVMDGWAVTQ